MKNKKLFLEKEYTKIFNNLGYKPDDVFGYWYTLNGEDWDLVDKEGFNLKDEIYDIGRDFGIIALLKAQVCDWLRTEPYMYVEVYKHFDRMDFSVRIAMGNFKKIEVNGFFDDYYVAQEEGIKECLKRIKIKLYEIFFRHRIFRRNSRK